MKTFTVVLTEKQYHTVINALNSDYEICDDPHIEEDIVDCLHVFESTKEDGE